MYIVHLRHQGQILERLKFVKIWGGYLSISFRDKI
jgi:hypothetical protein